MDVNSCSTREYQESQERIGGATRISPDGCHEFSQSNDLTLCPIMKTVEKKNGLTCETRLVWRAVFQ